MSLIVLYRNILSKQLTCISCHFGTVTARSCKLRDVLTSLPAHVSHAILRHVVGFVT